MMGHFFGDDGLGRSSSRDRDPWVRLSSSTTSAWSKTAKTTNPKKSDSDEQL